MNREYKWILNGLLILFTTMGGCATGDFLPRSQWARFDLDDANIDKNQNYFSQHRVVTLDGHDLYSRRSARVSTTEVDCSRRDCRLYPGTHTIELTYRWSSLDAEKKRRRKETLGDIGLVMLVILGAATGAGIPDPPSSAADPIFPCYAAMTLKAQAEHQYVLVFVDADAQAPPEQVQIVDTETGAVAASSSPLC